MSKENENIDNIASEVRAEWQGCENCSLGELDGKDLLALVDRFVAAHKREAESIERIVRDAVIDYNGIFPSAPNDDCERELMERAATANAWLKRHGFEEEPFHFNKTKGCAK